MTDESERIQAVFLAASEIRDPERRAAFLDDACDGDPGVKSRVEALLRAHDRPNSLLDHPAVAPHDPDAATTRTIGHEGGAVTGNEAPIEFLEPARRLDSLGRFGRFEVLEVLGRGGFGIVFRAFDDKLHREVAVKVLSPQLAATSRARKRFLREARSAAPIQHENVVRVFETGEEPLPYLVMELIPGETLQQRLDRDGPFEPVEVVRIGQQIAEGLAAAHATGLIHRDIKPGNILLESRTQKVKLTDFGLARAADDATISQSGVIAGTPMYMSPEQARGEPLDQRTDLFSLGSVMHLMLTGHPPFQGGRILEVLANVCDKPHPPIGRANQDAPQSLCAVVDRLLAKSPDDRYASAQEVAYALADCLRELSEPSQPNGGEPQPFILFTSRSPRRKVLLEQIGYLECNDFMLIDLSLKLEVESGDLEVVKSQVVDKARDKVRTALHMNCVVTHGLHPPSVVIAGADTVVWCNGKVLDRPVACQPDKADRRTIQEGRVRARELLRFISGKSISIITGLVLAQADNLHKEESCCVVTEARMRPFTDDDIERYLQSDAPLFLAGAFGIQERGVALFERLEGSYPNVVGLPINEFLELLFRPKFRDRVRLPGPPPTARRQAPPSPAAPTLSAMALGDINFDLTCNEFPAGLFQNLKPPGPKEQRKIHRRAGGTAVTFARGARAAGFDACSVLGVIGGDAFGRSIVDQLARDAIRCVFPPEINQETSIAVIFRDRAAVDTSVTVTDAKQSLTEAAIDKVEHEIAGADAMFVSGYALADINRYEATLRAMELAKRRQRVVVLDVVVGMSRMDGFRDYDRFMHTIDPRRSQRRLVDVLVAEIPDVLRWLQKDESAQHDFDYLRREVLPVLGADFEVVLLRTSDYSHELALFPLEGTPGGPRAEMVACTNGTAKRAVWRPLDYQTLPAEQRLGYADALTAKHLYRCLSPRIVLASASPRRAELLRQLAAPNKFEVRVAGVDEATVPNETPEARVVRLAFAKADAVRRMANFSPHVEVIIGADTEIVVPQNGARVVAGNPKTDDEARSILRRLSGTVHEAVTGVAVIHTRRTTPDGTPFSRQEVVTTKVTFRKLRDGVIEEYVRTREPLGKAGAYGIQGKGGLLVERIEGSYSNVVGLPLERLSRLLAEDFSIPIWDLFRPASWSAQGDLS